MGWKNPLNWVHDRVFAPTARAINAPGADKLGFNEREQAQAAEIQRLFAEQGENAQIPSSDGYDKDLPPNMVERLEVNKSGQTRRLYQQIQAGASGRFKVGGDEYVLENGQIVDIVQPDRIMNNAVKGGIIGIGGVAGGLGAASVIGAGGAGAAGAGAPAAGAGATSTVMPATAGTLGSTSTIGASALPAGGAGIGGAGGAAAGVGGAAAAGGRWANVARSASGQLGGAADGIAQTDAQNERTRLSQQQLELQRRLAELAAPGVRMGNSVQASYLANGTTGKFRWGGPGSGLRGEIPAFEGGFGPEQFLPETRQLGTTVAQQGLEDQTNRYDRNQSPLQDPSQTGGWGRKALGAGSMILDAYRAYRGA